MHEVLQIHFYFKKIFNWHQNKVSHLNNSQSTKNCASLFELTFSLQQLDSLQNEK